MGKIDPNIYMLLDNFKKAPDHSGEKSRRMSIISKILFFYRFKRIRTGLFFLLLLVYLFSRGMHKTPEVDFYIAIGFYVIISIIALFFLISGIKRMSNTISIIEYGTLVSSTVTGFKEWVLKSRLWAGPGTTGSAIFSTRHKRGCIICTYSDSAGKPYKLEIFFHNDEDQIKKGDSFSVIYDPEMPENAIAVKALPKIVKTDPAL
jgi:hypothetical protein